MQQTPQSLQTSLFILFTFWHLQDCSLKLSLVQEPQTGRSLHGRSCQSRFLATGRRCEQSKMHNSRSRPVVGQRRKHSERHKSTSHRPHPRHAILWGYDRVSDVLLYLLKNTCEAEWYTMLEVAVLLAFLESLSSSQSWTRNWTGQEEFRECWWRVRQQGGL